MTTPEVPAVPGAWESRAFFAALLAACQGDDKAAGDILREMASRMTGEFLQKGVKVGRSGKA